jgi:hypothetical protein
MTKILYWNLLKFGPNGLYPTANTKRARVGNKDPAYVPGGRARPLGADDAEDRVDVVIGVIHAVQPDIISIVEVLPAAEIEGTPVDNAATKSLLKSLRSRLGRDFRLVPPIVTGTGGRREGVAVYYDSAKLRFLGPWGWSGAGTVALNPAPAPAPVLAAYAAPWSDRVQALPNKTFSAGWRAAAPWLPAGCNENTLSGKWNFNPLFGPPRLFPGVGNRRPWLTVFGDNTVAPGNRIIKLFSLHGPPQLKKPPGASTAAKQLAATAQPRGAIAKLATLAEVADPIPANEVRCIVGDFNISAFDTASDARSYALLRNAGYVQHLNPGRYGPPFPAPAPPIPYTWPSQGYYATHTTGEGNPWVSVGAGPSLRGYPGFGYVSSYGAPGDWYDAIDNVFTRDGGAGAVQNFTVVNPVLGSPYTGDPNRPPNVMQGAQACASQMNAGAALFDFDPANGRNGISEYSMRGTTALTTFELWDNYAKIKSLTDHFPLSIEV